MSKTILLTVSDDRSGRKGGLYGPTQSKIERIFNNNPDFGLKQRMHMRFDRDIAGSPFYQEHIEMLSQPDAAKNGRLYKPHFIREALATLVRGDFLIYNDCSPEMWAFPDDFKIDPDIYSLDVIRVLTEHNRDFLTAFVKWDSKPIPNGSFGIHTHDNFTTETCIEIMKGEDCRHSFQCASGMICIKKTKETVALVDNWYHYNRMRECSTMNVDETEDSFYSGGPGRKLGNRHDQSILSMLLNQQDRDYVDILHNDMNPYNFLNFCRKDASYTLINSNSLGLS